MKKILLGFFAVCTCLYSFAQNNVGIGTSVPDPSSILELKSSTQGLLVPRTTIAAVTAVYPAPSTGLMIYDTDSLCFVLYNGTRWRNLCNSAPPGVGAEAFNNAVGINPDGTVFVIDSNGQRRLSSAPVAAWITSGNSGTTAGTNFVGTTDPQDLVFKSNSTEIMRATQSGAVGINQPAPNGSAILDIVSTSKGVLFPSMTTAQVNAIAAPAVGLMVYNATLNVHQSWNGTCWVNVGQTVCSFIYNVTQSHSSDCLFKSNFNSVSDTLTVSLISGTPSPVILSAAGVPAGVLVNFSKNYLVPTQTSVMTFTALPSAPNGTYPITIIAQSGSTIQTLSYTLIIYDFAATLNHPSSNITFAQAAVGGIIDTVTLSIGNASACNSTGGNALLSYSITPSAPGLSVSFGTPTLSIPGSTVMSITSSCPSPGTYQIYVTSTVGFSVSTSVYTITIGAPSPIHISANTQNLNLYTLAGNPACPVVDTFIVDPGVTVGSATSANSAAGSAMMTGSFASGSHIVIINNGSIIGAGGTGGNDIGYGGTVLGGACSQIDGLQGGNALWINTANVRLINNGVIASGGGGGGAGQALGITACSVDVRPGTGGGGGAGSAGGAGGSDGGGSYPCNAGNSGTIGAGGTGGATCQVGPCRILFVNFGPYNAGQGGTGGGLGLPGNPGASASALIGGTGVCAAGAGGAPGFAIVENGNTPIISGAAVVGPILP